MDTRQVSAGLYSAKGWMKLVGVMMIIYGAFTAITIIGIVVAWLPIWMGVLLFQSASAVDRAYNADDAAALAESLNKIKTYFTIMGVLTLIGLILMGLVIFLGGIAAITGGMSSM
ncbi:MAG: DUF5362 domain-containing protein [Gammaproteobacteria bacterium]|nr:DUF5362 domain-containing protein [Gammaproteobacteria bacterium]